MERRQFIINTGKWMALSGSLVLLDSCGGGSTGLYGSGNGGNATQQGGSCLANGTTVLIQVIHSPNHTLTIPASDVAAGVEKIYTLADNGSGHTHTVTITAADFAHLKLNNGVMELSSFSSGHSHSVVVNCA